MNRGPISDRCEEDRNISLRTAQRGSSKSNGLMEGFIHSAHEMIRTKHSPFEEREVREGGGTQELYTATCLDRFSVFSLAGRCQTRFFSHFVGNGSCWGLSCLIVRGELHGFVKSEIRRKQFTQSQVGED